MRQKTARSKGDRGVYRIAIPGPEIAGGGAPGQAAKEVKVGATDPMAHGPGGQLHHQQVKKLRPPRIPINWFAGSPHTAGRSLPWRRELRIATAM